jgi:predicted RNA-binding protein with PIN domain
LTLTDRLLRPALEAALAEARAGLSSEPPIPPPPRLRRLLGFTKATGPALHTVRRVVDEDAAFRDRVRAATTPEAVGPAGWLWLERSSGWKVQFARLLEAAEADEADMAADRGLAQVQRSLEHTEHLLDRATARADAAEAALAAANSDLAQERGARREAEERAARTEADLAAVTEERATAVRAWKDAERALGVARAELQSLRRGAVEPSATDEAATPGRSEDDAGAERAALAAALARVAAVVDEVGVALDVAVDLLGPVPPGAAEAARSDPVRRRGPVSRPGGDRSEGDRRGGRRGRNRDRRPSPLPPGRYDDDPAVVEHLVRLPGALLLVDGYNVTKTAWPDLPASEQRDRLVGALDSLNARTGAEAVVVFDGAEIDTELTTGARRGSGAVRVRFSPQGVEADDIVLELAAQVPATRPVVVVSSDNRVREGARDLGANVVGSAQFLAAPVLGRSPRS